jgi:phage virion morphogenesis protein
MSVGKGFFIDPGEMREIAAWIEEKKRLLSAKNGGRLYRSIGEYMRQAILRNFAEQHDPGGEKWASHSAATEKKRRKGDKTGNNNKILQDGGALMGSIGYRLARDGVIIGTVKGDVGTVLKYARAMQYGIPKPKEIRVSVPDVNGRYYSRTMKVPWGPIPPRPFVGIDQKNIDHIAETIEKYILLDDEGGEA